MKEVEANKLTRSFRLIVKDIKKEVGENKRTQNEKNKEFAKALDRFGALLSKVKETIENADESLGLMLLAIKQREYLYTEYPAQHGYPQMKVPGKHPAKR